MRRTRYVGTIAVALLMALTAAVAGCGSGETTTTEAAETPTTAAETSTTMVEDTTTTTQVETVFQQAEKQSLATLGEIPTPSKTYKIGYLMITLQNPFWVTLGEGAKAAAAEYGMEISVQSAPTENDVTSQLNTLETMAGQDFDAIIVHTITADNLVPGIVTARKKGVLVVDADGRVNGMAVKAEGVELPQFNMIDFEKKGQLGAEYIIAKVGSGEGKVAIIEGLAGAPQSDARAAGAKKAFEAAGFKVVASQPGNWDRTTALNVATNILQANPDLVGFYAANDVMALAASEAVSQVYRRPHLL
ncbi:MAG: substrate-binding domain-containing protein, partial [Actinobacteria bacterium]|nr:substrate-binding domain-containing protein [Actinomycetota bacterium]